MPGDWMMEKRISLCSFPSDRMNLLYAAKEERARSPFSSKMQEPYPPFMNPKRSASVTIFPEYPAIGREHLSRKIIWAMSLYVCHPR
jgi:hypothetical protein